MRRIVYSVCIGSLALALTAGAQQVNDRKPQRARPQQRTANVHAARPANSGAMMGARHYSSTAPYRQRSYMTPRSNSNTAMNQNARMQAVRERNFARDQEFRARNNAAVNPTRNLDVNRERNVSVNRTRNVEMNGVRNADQFRARNNLAINRNSNAAVNGARNFAYYRGGTARINNNFHSAAFRGTQYVAFRNYHRQWHDRGWWRSHYNRIVFVSGGWYYWNAGYWFPAWGYAASAYYPYDGPIYGYNGLPPDQITVDVQQQLQRDGYYDGPIDGVLGPMTREAIAAFQADNGLSVTSVIDQPTLATLGIA
jgi:hypothetical protein